SIVMGLYGNAIYKRHVQRKVQAIYRKQSSVDLQQNLFKRKGRVNFLGVLLASLIVIAVYVIPSIYIPFDPAGIEQIRNGSFYRSEEHTSELQSRFDFVCRLLLEKKKIKIN